MSATTVLRLRATASLACALAIALVACGDDDRPATTSDPPTTTAPSTTVADELDDEAALRQLTEDWYETIDRIVIDGADLTLADGFAIGDYREAFETDIRRRRQAGLTAERGEKSRVVVRDVAVDGDSATVTSCVVDAGRVLDAEGAVLDDAIVTYIYETSASLTANGWRFTRQHQDGDAQDGDRCDA